MFEQGFYDRLGFGTLGYTPHASFDPAHLRVPRLTRPPLRLSGDDITEIHANRVRRLRGHGSVSFDAAEFSRAELMLDPECVSSFFLGFRDGPSGRLSHHLLARAKGENGPCTVGWMGYETGGQLIELLSVLRSLGDQVRQVKMAEPPQLQIQDLIDRPFRTQMVSRSGEMDQRFDTCAESQIRILDLQACLAANSCPVKIELNLLVEDPVAEHLDGDGWRGVGGDYRLRLGERCEVTVAAVDPALPTLRIGVGALSRMWIGSRSASSMALTDQLEAPDDLLAPLDVAFLPPASPHYDWMF